jgi:hypothetical protein
MQYEAVSLLNGDKKELRYHPDETLPLKLFLVDLQGSTFTVYRLFTRPEELKFFPKIKKSSSKLNPILIFPLLQLVTMF